MDLSPSHRHRKLPAELNREIFLCFNPATQRKFIWGLGWNFYDMFRHKLLPKIKKVCNPHGNRWNGTTTRATVAADGLHVSDNIGLQHVFAVHPFPISGPQCRVDDYPGTILYYYEVKGRLFRVGLSNGAIPYPYYLWIGDYSNSYAGGLNLDECWLSGETHHFELPEGAIQPRLKRSGVNVFGCGLVLDSEDKLSIFFTLSGKLMGRKILINPTVDRLFPAVKMMPDESFEANFGDDLAKPFEYDIKNCLGLGLACI